MNPDVDWFFAKKSKWQDSYEELRELVLSCKLIEELKWGCPCYTYQNNNVVLIHGFKDYCALLFMKGAILNDSKKILVQQTANVQSARQIRFTNIKDIINQKAIIKSYIKEAIAKEKEGVKVEFKKATEYEIPLEFQKVMNEMPELKVAFSILTPGRKRGYLLHFAAAKQIKTRVARIEKYIQQILNGKGLAD